MAEQGIPRKKVDVRLAPEALREVEKLAQRETEGNVSQMLRKLLGEALRSRR